MEDNSLANITFEISWDYEKLHELASIIVPIFFGIIAIVGFFGNSLVILVVLANTRMQSTTNLLIVNLAIADLLFVIFCIPSTASDYIFHIWPFSFIWCQIIQYLIVVTELASIYTLVIMSLDRFLAIIFPVSSRRIRTERITKITILCIWLTIIILAIPVPYFHGVQKLIIKDLHQHLHHVEHCGYMDKEIIPTKIYHTILLSITFIIPLIIISAMYLTIALRLRRKGSILSVNSQKGRKRVTRLVIVIVLAFALSWLPIQVILLLKSYGLYDENIFRIVLLIAAQTIAYSSSCINPLLYAFLSENFRKAFRKFIYCSPKYQLCTTTNHQQCTNGGPSGDRKLSSARTSTSLI